MSKFWKKIGQVTLTATITAVITAAVNLVTNKFKTKTQTQAAIDLEAEKLKNAQKHITPLGQFLRKTSLDELPQLLNILKGEMSFVGPRPVIYTEFNLLDERDKYGANDILPGLTGLAQLNGRDRVNYKDKARMDGEYAANITFLGDLKLILRTFTSVFTAKDIVEGRQDPKQK